MPPLPGPTSSQTARSDEHQEGHPETPEPTDRSAQERPLGGPRGPSLPSRTSPAPSGAELPTAYPPRPGLRPGPAQRLAQASLEKAFREQTEGRSRASVP